jgi:hypothetical protein
LLNQEPAPILSATDACVSEEEMAKRLGILAIVLVCAVAGLFLAPDIPLSTNIDASVPRENIVTEAIARRAITQGVDVDVSDIVKKCIAVGDNREAVMRYLKAMGFEIQFLPKQVDGKDVLLAIRYPMRRTLGLYYMRVIFTDALRVVVHFDAQTVAGAAGHIVYRAS